MGENLKIDNINEEILRRIEIMDDPSYDPGPAFNKKTISALPLSPLFAYWE